MVRSLSRDLRSKYGEQMVLEVERVALDMFEINGVTNVTVEEIAAEASISARTFYRHFPTRDDVFQVRIDQHAKALEQALAGRPDDESPMRSLREALVYVIAEEDPQLRRRWMLLVESSPALVRAALGGIQLKVNTVISEFFGARLGLPPDDLIPTMLAAAVGGVLFATNARWLLEGGSLEDRVQEALEVLEGVIEVAAVDGGSPTD